MKKSLLLILGIALVSLLAFGGNAGMTTHITTLQQLQDMNLDLTEDYILDNDIDASPTVGWNAGAGFVPVGTALSKFTGSFDGQGYTITGLFINRPGIDFVGLFGYVDGAAYIRNVGLEDGDITGQHKVGILGGKIENCNSVVNCYATGQVKATAIVGAADTGGLLGALGPNSSLADSWANVSVDGEEYVGGLVGINGANSSISGCHALGPVTGRWMVGGLIGQMNAATVENSYAEGNVTGKTPYSGYLSEVGGLIGRADNDATTTNCYALGNAIAPSDGWYVAGLIARNADRSHVSDSYALGNAEGQDYVGGLLGQNHNSLISNCCAAGTAEGRDYVGGLIGYNRANVAGRSNVTLCHSRGGVTGQNYLGGLIGYNDKDLTIFRSFSHSSVNGTDYVGGLMGVESRGTLTNCYSVGQVTGSGANVGGLIGAQWWGGVTISACFWDTQTSNQATSAGGVGKTTEQMQTKSTFESAAWDFTNIWEICEPPTYLPSYPRLQGDNRCGLSPCSPAPPTEEALIISFTG